MDDDPLDALESDDPELDEPELDDPEFDEVEDPTEVLLEALEEADVVPDEPEAPEAIASISEAVSQAANKAAIAASNKNLFMSFPR